MPRFIPVSRRVASCLKLSLLGLMVLLMSGCALFNLKTPEEKFAAEVDVFIADLVSHRPAGVNALAPAAVMPASQLRGGDYTRLEEYVVERLSLALRQTREIYTPTRENWFELREGQPLTFAGQPADRQSYLDGLVVYQVAVSADEVLKQVKVQGSAVDARSKPIPGVLAEASFPIEDEATPALRQFRTKAKSSPVPEGLEEHPYISMDRLAYSLASELAEAYRANVSGAAGAPADAEVKIVLQTRTVNRAAGNGFLQQLESALQQAFVAKKGFTCAVSQKDFAPTFDQIDFYRKNRGLFEMDETLLSPGSVVLLAETFPHSEKGKIGINLRSLWRITPLENNQGQVLADNLGGTYLSGFTAKAYLAVDPKAAASGGYAPGSNSMSSPKDQRNYQPGGSRGFE